VDRETTTTTHEFVAAQNGRPAKIVDTFLLETSATLFAPADFEGIELRVHFNGDILSVEGSTALLVKVSFASVLSDLHETKSTFPAVSHTWESSRGDLPMVPKDERGYFMGGYSDEGGMFSFLFRLSRSAGPFSFGGLRLAFRQKMNKPETMYRFVDGVIEFTKFAEVQADPGMIARKVSGSSNLSLSLSLSLFSSKVYSLSP
jgi:hypothetical protein